MFCYCPMSGLQDRITPSLAMSYLSINREIDELCVNVWWRTNFENVVNKPPWLFSQLHQMPRRLSSLIGLALATSLAMLVGVFLMVPSMSPFDSFVYGERQAEVAMSLNPASEPPSDDHNRIVILPDNLEKDLKEAKEKERKEVEQRLKEKKKKQEEEERRKKKKQEEDKKRKKQQQEEDEKRKKKQEEADSKKKQEGEARRKKEEEELRIQRLAQDEDSFRKLKQEVESYERKLRTFKGDLDAASELRKTTKQTEEAERKKQEKKEAESLSRRLKQEFQMMEKDELDSIVNKPLVYTDSERTAENGGHVAPYGDKVVLLSASNNNSEWEQHMLDRSRVNRQEYCNLHGYKCLLMNLDHVKQEDNKNKKNKDHIVWSKIRAIEQAFNSHLQAEWIWWMDTDVLIMNPYIELGEHLLGNRALTERLTYGRPIRSPDGSFEGSHYFSKGQIEASNIHLLISQDFYGINAGSFFLRRSQFSKFLLDIWYDEHFVEKNFVFREQQALNHLLRTHETILQHTGLYPQRLFNSYRGQSTDTLRYQDGDLAIHLAGCRASSECKDKYDELFQVRKRVPKEFRVE